MHDQSGRILDTRLGIGKREIGTPLASGYIPRDR